METKFSKLKTNTTIIILILNISYDKMQRSEQNCQSKIKNYFQRTTNFRKLRVNYYDI